MRNTSSWRASTPVSPYHWKVIEAPIDFASIDVKKLDCINCAIAIHCTVDQSLIIALYR